MYTHGCRWTTERDQQLIRLIEQKLTGSQIAERMNITRGAVAGRVHRLKIRIGGADMPKREDKPKPPPAQTFNLPAPLHRAKARSEANVPPPTPLTFEPIRLSIIDLTEHTCRWPLGDPKTPEFAYCGRTDKLRTGEPYCEGHMKLASEKRNVSNGHRG